MTGTGHGLLHYVLLNLSILLYQANRYRIVNVVRENFKGILRSYRNALTDSSHSYILQLNNFEFQDTCIEKSVEGEEYSQYRCDREWNSPAERFLQSTKDTGKKVAPELPG